MADGYRSLSAPWIGGLSQTADEVHAGYQSLLAFWLGGAASPSGDVPPTPSQSRPWTTRKRTPGRIIPQNVRRDLLRDDEEFVIL
jgi:hypothetical protein